MFTSTAPVSVSVPATAAAMTTRPALQDPTQLRLHHDHCAAALGALHRVRGSLEALDAFVSPRFMTTLAVLAGLALAVVWLGA